MTERKNGHVAVDGGRIVSHHRIIGTACTVFAAWEPYANHSTITHFDGVRYGRMGTEPLPRELGAMPYGSERVKAVRRWQREKYERAAEVIRAAFPVLRNCQQDMGEIEVRDAR